MFPLHFSGLSITPKALTNFSPVFERSDNTG